MADNALGEYLRSRRERVRPDDVGIRSTSSRRVPGLRRDEVALLGGISTEYYTRLEQGRDRRPSAQVLDALARVLGLDDAERRHLHQLGSRGGGAAGAGGFVGSGGSARRRASAPRERVRPGAQELLDLLPLPAWIEGRYLDILYANALAQAVAPVLRPGGNILRTVVQVVAAHDDVGSDPAVRALVAQLRASAGGDPDDPRLAALLGELMLLSDDFAHAWSRHDVAAPTSSSRHTFAHPEVGDLALAVEKFRLVGAEEQVLVIARGQTGTDAPERLALLASLVATEAVAAGPA